MSRRLPHAEDTLGQWLTTLGLVLVVVVTAIWIGAGAHAGRTAATWILLPPCAATGYLAVLTAARRALGRVLRRRATARRLAALAACRPHPTELLQDFTAATARIPAQRRPQDGG